MRGCTDLLRRKLARGDMLYTGMIHDSRSGTAVEAFQEAGYDVLIIDREHTYFDNATVLEHIRLARALELPVMVRPADDAYASVCCVLDQAPDGIFIPRIRTRADAERVVELVKYPPIGKRGLGGSTCPVGKYVGWDSVTEQIDYVNRDVVIGIQIETAEALDNLDEIISVPHLDIAVVGNDDLSIGMGIPGQWQHPDYTAAVQRMIDTCRQYGVLPGIAGGDPAWVRFWAERGMRMFWCGSDVVAMWQGVARQLQQARAAVADLAAEAGMS
jgi:2-keto-3-deoxy-L-rhamnonate aldolase RhmA